LPKSKHFRVSPFKKGCLPRQEQALPDSSGSL
jgi:hypothetical protein